MAGSIREPLWMRLKCTDRCQIAQPTMRSARRGAGMCVDGAMVAAYGSPGGCGPREGPVAAQVHAESVVLDLVQPAGSGGDLIY